MNKKVVIAIIVVVVLVLGGIAIKYFFLRAPFRYAGTIEATQVDVPVRVSSVIATLDVHEGDAVKEGQTLVTLSCEDIKIAADQAQRDLVRAARLLRQGSMPQEDYERIRTQAQDARLRMEWCEVRSPLSGTVLTRYHEPGELVSPGVKLFTIADLHNVYAYIYVAQPEVVRVHLGDKLIGYLPEIDRGVPGTVVKINSEAEFTPKNVQTREERTRLVYGVKVNFPNDDSLLKPGMTVEIALDQK